MPRCPSTGCGPLGDQRPDAVLLRFQGSKLALELGDLCLDCSQKRPLPLELRLELDAFGIQFGLDSFHLGAGCIEGDDLCGQRGFRRFDLGSGAFLFGEKDLESLRRYRTTLGYTFQISDGEDQVVPRRGRKRDLRHTAAG